MNYVMILFISFASAELQLIPNNFSDIAKISRERIRTNWPLKSRYPGLKITNLNKYLSYFSTCSLTLQNYQGIDIAEPELPITLVRYDIAKYDNCTSDDNDDDSYHDYTKTFIEKVPPLENLTCGHVGTTEEPELEFIKSNQARWTCFALIDLFPPEVLDAPHFYENQGVITGLTGELLVTTHTTPPIRSKGDGTQLKWTHYILKVNYYSFHLSDYFNLNTRNNYAIAIVHLNTTATTITFWNLKSFYSRINSPKLMIFHFKAENLRNETFPQDTIAPQEVQVLSMHFLYPYTKLIQISIPLNESVWKDEVDYWTVFRGPLFVQVDKTFNSEKFFDVPFTLRNALAHSRLVKDRGLAECVFPNVTFLPYSLSTVREYNNQAKEFFSSGIFNSECIDSFVDHPLVEQMTYPDFQINSTYDITVRTASDIFTFLSCGRNIREKPNFDGLISVFDKSTWILIILFVIIWPVILSCIERPEDLGVFLNYCDAVLVGWSMLVEQSHMRASNYKRRTSLYYFCGFSVLVLIVVSNAYKGDNFKSLTKSFQIVPFEYVKQLVESGYEIYSKYIYVDGFIWRGMRFRVLEFEDVAESLIYGLVYQQSLEHFEFLNSSIKAYPLEENIYNESIPLDVGAVLDHCNNTAFVGWKRNMFHLFRQLENKHGSSKVFLGKEIIFEREYGWSLRRYKDPQIFKRIKLLAESGIGQELISLENDYYDPYSRKDFKPLSLNGNIVVQFSIYGCGILLSISVAVLEGIMVLGWFVNYGKHFTRLVLRKAVL